ncbi:MAG: OmpA family protein [Ginsengibacter sp.]
MKKAPILLLLLFTIPFIAQAQILKKMKEATEQTAENKVAQKTGETVGDGMDKSIDAVKGLFKKKNKEKNTPKESDNEIADIAEANIEADAIVSLDTTDTQFGVFSKFTFIPGNKVIFYDDFAKDATGDFPVNWETGGSGEVVSLSNEEGKWLSLQRRSGYFPAMPTELPENYTIEFDLVTNGYGTGKPSSKLFLAFLPKKAYSMGQAGSVSDIELLLYSYFSVARVENFGSEAKIKVGSVIDRHLPELLNAKMHISIAVNKQRLRFWINEEKYVDAPSILQGKMGRYFILESMDILPEKGQFAGITNFRISEAGEDLRSKLMKDGKFSTTGIYFNTNSAVVKKESFGILKSIADMLKSDENLKVNIVGHTDAVGDEAFNEELSLRRAEAVKNILVNEFSINGDRLQFSGKGETQPVDENDTEKGRSNNRRVEFIKI